MRKVWRDRTNFLRPRLSIILWNSVTGKSMLFVRVTVTLHVVATGDLHLRSLLSSHRALVAIGCAEGVWIITNTCGNLSLPT